MELQKIILAGYLIMGAIVLAFVVPRHTTRNFGEGTQNLFYSMFIFAWLLPIWPLGALLLLSLTPDEPHY